MTDAEENQANTIARQKFGRFVKEARMGLDMTPVQLDRVLCDHAQIDFRRFVSNIERNGATPKNKIFFALCVLLGIDPDECGFVGLYADDIKWWKSLRRRGGEA